MRLALEVWGNDVAQVLATCQRAEDLGFDAFYYGESPHGLNLDCWTTLAALAVATDRIRVGPVITNVLPSLRSPLSLGKQAATVGVLSGGRLDFRTGVGAATGFGRAWWLPHGVHYPSYDERWSLLDDALPTLRRYWAGGPVTAPGSGQDDLVELGFDCPPIPVTIAATGPRGLAMAAAHAEVWEASFATPAEYQALARGFEAFSAERVVSRSLEIDAAVGTTPETARLAQAAFEHDRHGEDMQALRSRALLGHPPEVAGRMAALADVGVEQLVIAGNDPHQPEMLEALITARSLLEA